MPRLLAPVLPPGSLNSLQPPVLEVDDRFSLRPWTLDDVPVVVAAYSDPEIRRWIPYSYDTVEAAQVIRKWAEAWENETGACWAIANCTDGSAFGRLAFQTIDLISGSAELAYWVRPTPGQRRGGGNAGHRDAEQLGVHPSGAPPVGTAPLCPQRGVVPRRHRRQV